MSELSIIIVSWNTREILLDCLQSVVEHPPRCSYDIWVVDNASADGSAAAVRERFPDVHVIANEQNVGFAAANNQAIVVSSGTAILLLNSDTLVHAEALDRMVAFMATHRRVGIAGAHLLNADGTLQTSWSSFPTLWSELRGQLPRTRRTYPTLERFRADAVDWVGGAALLIRRTAVDQIGLMDDGFFMYSEETDWCYRVKQAGWDVCYLPDADITHLGGQSSRQVSVKMKGELYRSKIRFFHKHYGSLAARQLQLMLQLGFMARAAAQWILGRIAPGRARRSGQHDDLAVAEVVGRKTTLER